MDEDPFEMDTCKEKDQRFYERNEELFQGMSV